MPARTERVSRPEKSKFLCEVIPAEHGRAWGKQSL